MTEDVLKKAQKWSEEPFDEDTRQEIRDLLNRNDEKELTDRFYKELEFGTGGMRGVMGAGTNRMNTYTVGKATQGLADYLIHTYNDARERGVSIACDSRNNSGFFSREVARVLAGNGIKVYIYPQLRPTPLLSFTVRHFGNRAGIVITASHNPKEYNGYKVYAPDGAQVTSPEDAKIVEFVQKVDISEDVKRIDYDEGLRKGLIKELDESIEREYLDRVDELALKIRKGIEKELLKVGRDIKVVYTPLHGTGITLVPEALKKIEGAVILCEKEQSVPDGNFTTTPSPNPEETEALSRAIDYAKQEKADMVIATDPDCDRMGLAVPDENGEFVPVNGNQIGCLLADLIAKSYRNSGLMPKNPVLISTIVSTELAREIAGEYGVEIINVLTGFKFIGALMGEMEKKGKKESIFGFEESYGYLAGTFVRDKDGVIAALLALMLLKYAISEHGSFLGYLYSVFRKFGMYLEYQKSFALKGAAGAEKIKALMEALREDPPGKISGSEVIVIKDYLTRKLIKPGTGEEEFSGLPVSNVLQFFTADDVKVSVRPSGTEPKIKFYFGLKVPVSGSIEETRALLNKKAQKVSEDVFKRCGLN
jgi:phosphoglucomutase